MSVEMSVERYTIISADGHAGGSSEQYRTYLDPSLRDLQADGRTRNWDTERRLRELDADGVVAEVIFPNTIPPFFPTGQVIAPAPSAADYRRRLAGSVSYTHLTLPTILRV